jgi:hypothetical protein
MGPVRHLGSGSNELVSVIDERPEVGQHLHPVSRGQDLPAGHDPGDGYRVDQVRLALGASPASLPVSQGGRHFPDVLRSSKEVEGCIYSDPRITSRFPWAVRPAPNPRKSSGDVPTLGGSANTFTQPGNCRRPLPRGPPPRCVKDPPPPSGDEPWGSVSPENGRNLGGVPIGGFLARLIFQRSGTDTGRTAIEAA